VPIKNCYKIFILQYTFYISFDFIDFKAVKQRKTFDIHIICDILVY